MHCCQSVTYDVNNSEQIHRNVVSSSSKSNVVKIVHCILLLFNKKVCWMTAYYRVRPIELFCVSADTDYLPNRYADISAFPDNLPIYNNICRYNRYLPIQGVICSYGLHVYAYQHAILQHLVSDLCRYICRYGFYRQIKYLSADIRHICRYADMVKFCRYLSGDISAGIYRQVYWQILSADWTIGRTLLHVEDLGTSDMY